MIRSIKALHSLRCSTTKSMTQPLTTSGAGAREGVGNEVATPPRAPARGGPSDARTGDDPPCDVARRQRVPPRASASSESENAPPFATGRTDKLPMSVHFTTDFATSWTSWARISCFEAPTRDPNRGKNIARSCR